MCTYNLWYDLNAIVGYYVILLADYDFDGKNSVPSYIDVIHQLYCRKVSGEHVQVLSHHWFTIMRKDRKIGKWVFPVPWLIDISEC